MLEDAFDDDGGDGMALSMFGDAANVADSVVVILRVAADGFDAGNAKRPSAFLKNAGKIMKTVQFDYQTDARLVRWIERHFAEYGLTVSQEAAMRILTLCGRSMYRLSGELAKAAAYTAEIEGNSVKITCWGGSTTPLTVTASYGEYSTGAEIGLKGI